MPIGKRGGSSPGERRGGRQKGTLNRSVADLEEKLAALGCDPIEGMALIAVNDKNPLELRAKMFAQLAEYVSPKRKAVEMTGADQGPLLVTSIYIGQKMLAKPESGGG